MVNVGVGCVVRRRRGCAWAWPRVVAGRACAVPRVRCCCVPAAPVLGGASACPYPKPYVCHCLSYGRNWSRLGQDQAVVDKACGFVEVVPICSDMNGSGRTRVPLLSTGLRHGDTAAGGELPFAPSLEYRRDSASSQVLHDGRARPPLSGGGISPGLKGTQEGGCARILQADRPVLQPRGSSALGLQVSGSHDGCGRG